MNQKYRLFASAILALFLTIGLNAQEKGHNIMGFARWSHVIDGHGIYDEILQSYNYPLGGIQFGFDTHPKDSSYYASAWNFPHFALGASFANMGSLDFKNDSRLGNIVNLYGSARFDIIRNSIIAVSPVLELGFAYSPERYHFHSNAHNLFIGSNVFFDLGAGLETAFHVTPHWDIALTAYLTHHSNGMLRVPNWGINEFSAGGALRYNLTPVYTGKRIRMREPEYRKGLQWNIYAAGGVHSCDVELKALRKSYENGKVNPDDSYRIPARPRLLAGVEGVWRYSPLFAAGMGLEGNYAWNDYRNSDLVLKGEEDPAGYSPFYAAAYLTHEFYYNRLSFHIMWGLYLYKKTGLTEDMGKTFQRVGARYHFSQNGKLYAGLDMRAHYCDRSYCLELSIGMTL